MFSGTTLTDNNAWRRSSRCSIGSCVEILLTDERVFVRDSKQNNQGDDQPRISIDPSTWCMFLDELLGLTAIGSNGVLAVRALSDGWVELVDASTGTSLSYDSEEWTAFVEGVELGEMTPPLAA